MLPSVMTIPALVLGGMLLLGKRRARGTASLGDEEALRIITGEVARLTGHRPLPFFAAEREQRQDVRFLP